jgi:hypothetical protein
MIVLGSVCGLIGFDLLAGRPDDSVLGSGSGSIGFDLL